MTVAELIAQLQQLDQTAPVFFKDVWTEEQVSIDNVQEDDGEVLVF
jgi:hypothetical protein